MQLEKFLCPPPQYSGRKQPSLCKTETSGSMVNISEVFEGIKELNAETFYGRKKQKPLVLILQRISSHHFNLPYSTIC